ncbi:MAG: YkgJ family cysteine cluster protein [Armatimonadota bacterium]
MSSPKRKRRQKHFHEPLCVGDANCCKKLILILQLEDIERICTATGMHPRQFVRLYRPGEVEEEEGDEEAYIQTRSGRLVMGTRRPKDRCYFLNGRKCRVYPLKPLNCTIYPVDYQYPPSGTRVVCRNEKWCGAKRGPRVSVKPYLRLGDEYDRRQERLERFVKAWNRKTKGRATGREFMEHVARYVRSRQRRRRARTAARRKRTPR